MPTHGGVVVSFARMDRILDIRPADRCAVVEPGVLNGDAAARRCSRMACSGRRIRPAPSVCTVGGNLAYNAGGPRAVKYGATRDNVLALVAVTGAGELVRVGGAYHQGFLRLRPARLLVGSEGTLALIVEATLKLAPRPQAQAGLRAFYRDAASAAAAVSRLMAQPVMPAMLEFMDAPQPRSWRATSAARRAGSRRDADDRSGRRASMRCPTSSPHSALPPTATA